jgi:hypothetical protein
VGRGSIIKRVKVTPYYFELKTHIFSHISEMKIRACLKFEVLFSTLRKSQQDPFPGRTSGLAKNAVNLMESEMYLLAIVSENPFLKMRCVLY